MKMMALLLSACLLTVSSLSFAEATISEVYQAAESGQVERAQQMMKDVLAAHPQSAKAHFVEAELLLRQGRREDARAEYIQARQLDPSLSFAKPAAVASLQKALAIEGVPLARANPASAGLADSGHSWLWAILAVAAIVMLFRLFRGQRPPVGAMQSPNSGLAYPAAQAGNYAPGYPPPASGGSGLMGSLATGAAIGAGVVAGEALAHRLLDSDRGNPLGDLDRGAATPDSIRNDDMGGDNFGISDDNSWDSGGSSDGDW